MKKILTIIILSVVLIYSAWLYRDAKANVILGGYYGGAYTCPVAGTTYSYDGDHPTDNDTACDSAGAALAGTIVDATVTADYVLVENTNDYLMHSIDASELDGDEGTIWLDFYLIDGDTDEDVEEGAIFEIFYDTFDNMCCWVDNSDKVRCEIESSSDGGSSFSPYCDNETIVHNQWYTLGFAWSKSGGQISITSEKYGEAVDWDDNANQIKSFGNQPTSIKYGELSMGRQMGDDVRTRNGVICASYKCADPR